jgi:hypothetical protein
MRNSQYHCSSSNQWAWPSNISFEPTVIKFISGLEAQFPDIVIFIGSLQLHKVSIVFLLLKLYFVLSKDPPVIVPFLSVPPCLTACKWIPSVGGLWGLPVQYSFFHNL